MALSRFPPQRRPAAVRHAWTGYAVLYPLATAARTRSIGHAVTERLRRRTEV
ncbi:hypothetical protein [Streptomyces nojiriensis]|uniref:hypothetical protein n=1 Tax=Streptomyces nojiriensis TaxID=66374 RepID=UPI00167B2608|nr:hypothetical protein [Streptomyces nojiriensis]